MAREVTDLPEPLSPTMAVVLPSRVFIFALFTALTIPWELLKKLQGLLFLITYYLLNFGSKASLRASPTIFKTKIVKAMAIPGNRVM